MIKTKIIPKTIVSLLFLLIPTFAFGYRTPFPEFEYQENSYSYNRGDGETTIRIFDDCEFCEYIFETEIPYVEAMQFAIFDFEKEFQNSKFAKYRTFKILMHRVSTLNNGKMRLTLTIELI